MPLEPGVRLAHYEIVSALGAGGMGEVYRARDSHLDREVAIKVLPEGFGDDAERLARFEREAKLLASLNHPNVAAIHGFEESAGSRFLVLELVEGLDLQERLAAGPIPLDETIDIARQIALALAEAHAKGVVHRDLKPANVKWTPEGQVKVLDFGLAKAWAGDPTVGDTSIDLTHSPTLTHHATVAGVILGTAAYMSPEQARGRPVDQRADLWAFGVVVWEMLTGRLLFDGETVSDVMAAVLTRDPDERALPASAPPALRRLLRRCLARDPRQRLHSAADAVLELDEAAAEITQPPADDAATGAPPRRRPLARLGLAAAALLIGGFGGWLLRTPEAAPPAPAARFAFARASELGGEVLTVAFSPQGDAIAFDTEDASPIHVRALDSFESRTLPGTERGGMPFFSPDGRWLGFYSDGKLRKVPLAGGNPTEICDASDNSPGATWGPDGRILFAPTWTGNGLWMVDAEGGEPTPISRLRPEEGESSHFWADFLPGGRFALFTVFGGRGLADSSVAVLDLESGEHVKLFRGARPSFVASGHVVFFRDGVYLAVPFDPKTRRATGEPLPLDLPIRHLSPLGGSERYLTFADNGALAYVPGASTRENPLSRLAWLDRDGRAEVLPFEGRHDTDFDLSTDGKRVVVSRYEGGQLQLWIYDIERGIPEPIDLDGMNFDPQWRPGGRSVSFTTQKQGNFDLSEVAADGSSPPTTLVATPTDEGALRWAPDGDSAVFVVWTANGRDLWRLSATGEKAPLLETPANEFSRGFSRDGRWVAYQANGAVYVARWPDLGERVLIAPSADNDAADWSENTEEFFFVSDGKMASVPYTVENGLLRPGVARKLFELPTSMIGSNFDVAPDGRFLVRLRVEDPPDEQIRVVLDGFSVLRGASER